MGANAEKDRREAGGIKLNKKDYALLLEKTKKGLAKHPQSSEEALGLRDGWWRWRANF